jgi:23S rRNA A2030 N6-methylase RlmJ
MTRFETQTHSTHAGNVEVILRRMRLVSLLQSINRKNNITPPREPSFLTYGTYTLDWL